MNIIAEEINSFPTVDEAAGWVIGLVEKAVESADNQEINTWGQNALEWLQEPETTEYALNEARASIGLCAAAAEEKGDSTQQWDDIWEALDSLIRRIR